MLAFPPRSRRWRPAFCAFVEAAFGGSSFETQPALRGVYLTSGTQTGTPIDRLAGAISRSFGLRRRHRRRQATDPASSLPGSCGTSCSRRPASPAGTWQRAPRSRFRVAALAGMRHAPRRRDRRLDPRLRRQPGPAVGCRAGPDRLDRRCRTHRQAPPRGAGRGPCAGAAGAGPLGSAPGRRRRAGAVVPESRPVAAGSARGPSGCRLSQGAARHPAAASRPAARAADGRPHRRPRLSVGGTQRSISCSAVRRLWTAT